MAKIEIGFPPGNPSAQVPAGGTTGQVLTKVSNADYDDAWESAGVPPGGTTGQVLTKDSNADYDDSWQDTVTLPIAESDVTNLVADLAAKAPIASPTFTGIVKFNGTTAAFPALTNNGSELDVKLADNSGFAILRAQSLKMDNSTYMEAANGFRLQASLAGRSAFMGSGRGFTVAPSQAFSFFTVATGLGDAAVDAGISRGAAGQIKIGNGTAGDSTGTLLCKILKTTALTVATLPAAATAGKGARSFVTDSSVTTFNTVVASGGTNNVPVFSDGTNWRVG